MSTKEQTRPVLDADRPLSDPGSDLLGRAPFAGHLANAIRKLAPSEGLVMAIYGPWGSGKSTLLNFVLHYLNQGSKEREVCVITFNPWWFSGKEDLVRAFFLQLQSALGEKKFGKVRGQLSDLADTVAKTSIPWLTPGASLLRSLLKPKVKNVTELKKAIDEAFRGQQRLFLVVMDDIDRLTSDEIRDIFTVVKSVGAFPNTIYLLACDKNVVCGALESVQRGIKGKDYVEKVVQIPFDLPPPDKIALRRLLFTRLDDVLGSEGLDTFDENHWRNIYFDGIDPYITNPRRVVRLINALTITWPPVKTEVNPVDFIAVEALRLFAPDVYEIVRSNPDGFAGTVDRPSRENLGQFHQGWLQRVPSEHKESVEKLLSRLFPLFEGFRRNITYGHDFLREWRRDRRVCSPDIFPIYFRFAVPEGAISRRELDSLVSLIDDPFAFGRELVRLSGERRSDGTTRASAFLELFEDYTEDLPEEKISSVVEVLLDVGDQLLRPEDEPRGIFGFDNSVRIGRIIFQLLRRLDEPRRYEILKRGIENGRALAMQVREVAILGQQQGKYSERKPDPEEQWVLSAAHLSNLEQVLVEKIRTASQDAGAFLRTPRLVSTLYRWQDWDSEDEVRDWLWRKLDSDDRLLNFLGQFGKNARSQSVSDVGPRTQFRLDPEWLRPFVDPEEIVKRVKAFDLEQLSADHRKAAEQLLKEYEMRKRGDDPDNPLSWD